MTLCLGVFVFTSLLFSQDAPKPLPELKPFLADLRKTLHTDTALLGQYTYTEKRTLTQLDGNQKPRKTEVNVFEVFPGGPGSERIGYRRQTVKDGKPLSADELKKEDQDLKKRIETLQRKLDQRSAAERQRAREERLRREERIIDDVFGIYDVEITGREIVDGRPAISLKFHPRPSYQPKTSEGRNMQHVAGKAWIDEQDHQVARVELEIVDPISIGLGILVKLQKGATIVSERRKFNEEIWLPVKTDIALNARVLLLKGFNIRQVMEYSEHKKYSVDTILKFSDDPQR